MEIIKFDCFYLNHAVLSHFEKVSRIEITVILEPEENFVFHYEEVTVLIL